MLQPIVLGPNQPETFYRGAGRIGAFRGVPPNDRPEDWVASATPRYGLAPSGLTVLPDGATLLGAVRADPFGWLGDAAADTGVLVKLLDAGQRLPLHLHPTRADAMRHLGSPYGKTEAWLVLDAEPGADVRLGFSRDIDPDELRGWVEAQDTAAMLQATNRLDVVAGDAILCPAGTPHAIGAGILLLEVQEPTDLSILLEWDGFSDGPPAATLGLTLDEALACVDRRACSPTRLEELRTAGPGSLLPAEAGEFFRVDDVSGSRAEAGFSVLVVTDGQGALLGGWGRTPVAKGDTLVVPAGAGAWLAEGGAQVVRVRAAA